MEEVFLPGLVLDEPEPLVNPQRANLACHLCLLIPSSRRKVLPAIPSSVRRIAASFNHPSYTRHAGTQFVSAGTSSTAPQSRMNLHAADPDGETLPGPHAGICFRSVRADARIECLQSQVW